MNSMTQAQRPDVRSPICLMEIADTSECMESVVEGILWSRLRRMRARLQEVLADQKYGVMTRAMHQIYQSIGPDRQARVLLSSEFCEQYLCLESARKGRVESGADEEERAEEQARALGALHDIIAREKSIAELAQGRTDRYLREARQWQLYSPVGDCVAEKDAAGVWTLRQLPKLGDCIALDLESPPARHHEPRSGVLSQPCLPLTDAEREHVSRKLAEALAAIDRSEPMYGLLIRNFVRRITVRKSAEVTSDEAGRYGSEHVPRQPGSIRLLNTHNPELLVEACMESIMHESTHNYLAAWELANGFFVANDYRHRVVSPWSGNPIPDSSYIHAVFVYYVCHRLLKRHLEISPDLGEAAKRHVQRRLAVCAAGFLIEQNLSGRLMSKDAIHGEVGQMIDHMQAEMKREYRYGEWQQ